MVAKTVSLQPTDVEVAKGVCTWCGENEAQAFSEKTEAEICAGCVVDLVGALVGAGPKSLSAVPVYRKLANDYGYVPPTVALVGDYRRIAVEGVDGDQFNPGLCTSDDGSLLVNVRVVRGLRTYNYVGVLDPAGQIRQARELFAPPAWNGSNFEDLRLFRWGGRVWGVAAVLRGLLAEGRICQALCDLGADAERIEAVHIQPTPWSEKNWMPCVVSSPDGDRLRVIYSVDPSVTVLDMETAVSLSARGITPGGVIRGGSPLIPWRDGFLTVVHEQFRRGAQKPAYLHRFVTFNRELTRARLGRRWHFLARDVEFCAGLVPHEGQYVLSFGVRDREAWVVYVTEDALGELLR